MVKSRQFSALDSSEADSIKSSFIENEKVFSESVLLSELDNFLKIYNNDFVIIWRLKEILKKDLTHNNQEIVEHSKQKLEKIDTIMKLLESIKYQQQALMLSKQQNIVNYIKAINAYHNKFNATQRKAKNEKLLHSEEYKQYLKSAMVLSNYENLSFKEFVDIIDLNYLNEEEKAFANKNIVKDEDIFNKNLEKIYKYNGYISKNFLPNSLKDAEEITDGKYIDYDIIENTRDIIEDIKQRINEFYTISLNTETKSLDITQYQNTISKGLPVRSNLKKKTIQDKDFNRNVIKTIDTNTKIIEFLVAKFEYFKNVDITEAKNIQQEISNLSMENKNLALNSLKLEKLSAKNMEYIINQINYSNKIIKDSIGTSKEIYSDKRIEKFKQNMNLINMFNTKINQILQNDVLNEENKSELYILDLLNKNLRIDEQNIINSVSGSYKNVLQSIYNKQTLTDCSKQIEDITQIVFDNQSFTDEDVDNYIDKVVNENKFDKNSIITKKLLEPNNISISNNNIKNFNCYKTKNKVNVQSSVSFETNSFENVFVQKILEAKIQNVKEKEEKLDAIQVKLGKGFFKNMFAKIKALSKYNGAKFDLFKFKKNKYLKLRINNIMTNILEESEVEKVEEDKTVEDSLFNTVQESDKEVNNINTQQQEVNDKENNVLAQNQVLLENLNQANTSMIKKLLNGTYKLLTFSH